MTSTSEHPLIKQLRKDKSLLGHLGKVAAGDWDHLLEVAKKEGHHLEKDELIHLFPKGFYKGFGKRPDLGWPLDHHLMSPEPTLSTNMIWHTWKSIPLLEKEAHAHLHHLLTQAGKEAKVIFTPSASSPNSVEFKLEHSLDSKLKPTLEKVRASTSLELKKSFPDLAQKLGHLPLWSPKVETHSGKKSTTSAVSKAPAKPRPQIP